MDGFKMTLSDTERVINMIEFISILKELGQTIFSLDDFLNFYNSLNEEERRVLPKKEDISKAISSMTHPKLIHALEDLGNGTYKLLTAEKKEQYDLYFQSSKKNGDFKVLKELAKKYQDYENAFVFPFESGYEIKKEDSNEDKDEFLYNIDFDFEQPNEEKDSKNKIVSIQDYRQKKMELEKTKDKLLSKEKRKIKNIKEFFDILFYCFYEQGIRTIDKKEFNNYFMTYNTSLLTLSLSVLFERGIIGSDAKKVLSSYFDIDAGGLFRLQAMDEHNRVFYISLSQDYEVLKRFYEELEDHDKEVLNEIGYKYQNQIPMLSEEKEQRRL